MTSADVSLKKTQQTKLCQGKNHIRKTMTSSSLSWSLDFKIRLVMEKMFP
jgi:hypothetical protein